MGAVCPFNRQNISLFYDGQAVAVTSVDAAMTERYVAVTHWRRSVRNFGSETCWGIMMKYGNVEYIPDENGTAELVKCPLVDDWVSSIDCMENQGVIESAIPARFKQKPDWREICERCPFRDY